MAIAKQPALTVGVALIKLLERYQVEHVFGIPGVHTIELYRGLAASHIQHHTPRHEQGAGFMADGYARVSGKPGVCFVITGPGVTNILTAMGQALADSIPMLVISSVNDTLETQNTRGMLHEMPNQLALSRGVTRFSQTIHDAEELVAALGLAFTVFTSARPGPVHLQLPIALLGHGLNEAGFDLISRLASVPSPAAACGDAISSAAKLLYDAKKPLILTGGGAIKAATEVTQLVEKIDAPVHMTINARGLLPYQHALAVSASCTLHSVREKVNDSDVVLALGTELAATDYDQFKDGGFSIEGKLIRCDIDPMQINNNQISDIGLTGDAEATVCALNNALVSNQDRRGRQQGSLRAKDTMDAAYAELNSDTKRHLQILEVLRDNLPDCIIVGDSTQLVYSGNMIFNMPKTQRWFNSSVGFGTLGYALPAATGAAIAVESASRGVGGTTAGGPVVCLIGDGGLQFVLGELGALKDSGLPVAVIVWCNNGYREIKTSMENANVKSVGVEFSVPDFVAIALSYGIKAVRATNEKDICNQIIASYEAGEAVLIEVEESEIMH